MLLAHEQATALPVINALLEGMRASQTRLDEHSSIFSATSDRREVMEEAALEPRQELKEKAPSLRNARWSSCSGAAGAASATAGPSVSLSPEAPSQGLRDESATSTDDQQPAVMTSATPPLYLEC